MTWRICWAGTLDASVRLIVTRWPLWDNPLLWLLLLGLLASEWILRRQRVGVRVRVTLGTTGRCLHCHGDGNQQSPMPDDCVMQFAWTTPLTCMAELARLLSGRACLNIILG